MLSVLLSRTCASMVMGIPKITITRQIARGFSTSRGGIRWLNRPASIFSGVNHPSSVYHQPAATSHYWCRKVYLSTAQADGDETFREGETILTRTAVRQMKVAQLRAELSQLRAELFSRGLDTDGQKKGLVDRLLETVDQPNDTKKTAVINLQIPPEKDSVVPYDQEDMDDDYYDDDLTMAYYTDNSSPGGAIDATEQSIYQEQEVATSDIVALDPKRTYVIRVRNAPAGQSRVVEGVGIGMKLLVAAANDGSGALTLLETNQLLLPGNLSLFEADYCALIMVIREAKKRGIQKIVVEIDDVEIVRHLSGQGRVDGGYQEELCGKVLALKDTFESFEVRTPAGSEKYAELKVLTKTALAKQKPLESDSWAMADQPSRASTENAVSIDPKKEYLLRFDGGARGNPSGDAGAGMVIYDGDQEVWCGWKYLGESITNNIAEYSALIEGLHCAQKLGIRRIRAEGDSELVVKQVLGKYKVKKDWLIPLHKEVKQLSGGFDEFRLSAIRRAENSRADTLANHAMDVRDCHSVEELMV